MESGKETRDIGITGTAEIGAEIQEHGHERKGDEAQGEVVPFLSRVDVDEQGARKSGQNEEVRLEAEVAAVAEESDDGESESENSPGYGDPGPMAFAVGEDDDENGRGGGVELGGFDGGAGGFEAEPAGAEIEESDDERKGNEAGERSWCGDTEG